MVLKTKATGMDPQRILSETFVASAEHHEALGSTNDRARACAAEELPLPRLIVADRQTAGRGRGANRWWTGHGSLAMSLLLPPDAVPEDIGQSVLVSLVTGVAVVDALRPLVERQPATDGSDNRPGATAGLPSSAENTVGQTNRGTQKSNLDKMLGLHWPNDVMLAGRKLAGILIEALPGRSHVVGIGINTNNTAVDAPAELRDTLVTLRDATGEPCDHVELLVDLLVRLELGLRQLAAGTEPVVARANDLCLQGGQVLTIRTGEESLTGRCRGIGPDGALLLETSEGVRAIHSGVVQ